MLLFYSLFMRYSGYAGVALAIFLTFKVSTLMENEKPFTKYRSKIKS